MVLTSWDELCGCVPYLKDISYLLIKSYYNVFTIKYFQERRKKLIKLTKVQIKVNKKKCKYKN